MMASHHSYLHHHSPNPAPAAAPPCCSAHYNPCCSQPPPPPPPQHHASPELLLDALSLLLQRHPHKPHTPRNPNHSLHFQLHSPLPGEDPLTHPLISSLLQRITALEASLAHFCASSSPYKHSFILREAAARVIQSHFRSFLVRRSRTLSQLQDLAFIKSTFNSLKSSVSNRNRFNHGVVSQKAMDLLLQLDSIRGENPMIRDGKRSISGNIVRFLDFIDALSVKNHGHSRNPVKNVRYVRDGVKSRALNPNGHFSVPQKELVEKLSERVEKIRGLSRVFDEDEEDVELEGFQEFSDDDDEEEGNHRILIEGKHGSSKIRNGVLEKSTCVKPRVKKTVSFAEDGKLYRIYSESPKSGVNGDGSLSDGSNSSDDRSNHDEIDERNGSSRDGENEEVFEDQNASASNGSARNFGSEYIEIDSCHKDEDGRLLFSAPVPVKMEPRADLTQKRKVVKIIP